MQRRPIKKTLVTIVAFGCTTVLLLKKAVVAFVNLVAALSSYFVLLGQLQERVR